MATQAVIAGLARGILSGALVLISISSCGGEPGEAPQQQQQGPPPVPVTLQTLDMGTHFDTSQYVGTLQARQRVSVSPQVSGRLVEILVEEGEVVEAGQPLFLLDTEEQQASVEQAEARVTQSEAAVNTAAAEVDAAQSRRDSTAADLTLRKTEFNRQTFLADEGAVSEQARDEAQRNLDAIGASLLASEKEVVAAQKRLDQANADLAAAQAEVARRRAQLGFKQVLAPSRAGGTIGDILPRVGDFINAGQQMTTLTLNDEMELNVNIPVNVSNRLRLGLPVELIGPTSEDVLYEGEVGFINPTVDIANQTLLVKFYFDNDGTLKDDQFVKARVIWDETPGVLVPTSAVLRLGGQAFVFVAEQSSEGGSQLIARQKPVQLGTIQEQSYQVISGLQAGEQIITSGILNLTDGRSIAPSSEG